MVEQNKTIVRTLYIFTIAAFISSLIVMAAALVDIERVGLTAVAGAIGILSCLLFFWLLYRKQYTAPRMLIPLFSYALGTFLLSRTGLHDEALLLYPLALSLAGLLLGRAGILIYGLLIVLTVAGLGLTQMSPVNNLSTIVVIAILVAISAAMMYVLVNMLQENFEKIIHDQQLLTKANRELEAGHALLENQVRERTLATERARKEAEAARVVAEAARSGLEAQVWLTTGQAQLADAMRGEQELPQLARNVIENLCSYLGAQAGALYLLENRTLKQLSFFAYRNMAGHSVILELGEGLVGQAAEEGRLLVIDSIPPDAPLITTGLVSVTPRQVWAFPFQANGQVMGVIELSTLSSFTNAHRQLLERTSENIGIAFLTVRTRQKLADLLFESQQQAEELQAQEEELRAANEELQAQAESLKLTRTRRDRKEAK